MAGAWLASVDRELSIVAPIQEFTGARCVAKANQSFEEFRDRKGRYRRRKRDDCWLNSTKGRSVPFAYSSLVLITRQGFRRGSREVHPIAAD